MGLARQGFVVSCPMLGTESFLQSTYLAMIEEAIARLRAADNFLSAYKKTINLPELEAAILQVRKAFEATAYAAIAPNKKEYEAFRSQANDQPDYRKDYHAGKILAALSKINKKFYPTALLPATKMPDGTFHFERKESGYLTKKRFESVYDRLGKYLHADNPWASKKNIQNLLSDLPVAINELFGLLELHVTFIQTPAFNGAWVVETGRETKPRIVTGIADGEFIVQDS
jgi:hypothetical protein